jgi:hypothetical protein
MIGSSSSTDQDSTRLSAWAFSSRLIIATVHTTLRVGKMRHTKSRVVVTGDATSPVGVHAGMLADRSPGGHGDR